LFSDPLSFLPEFQQQGRIFIAEGTDCQHKISFETASLAFNDPLAMVVYDFANSTYQEDRYRLTGFLVSHSSFVTVSFTPRKEKDEYLESTRRNFG
jgi:uncharacterized DUF497 family protein